MSVMPQEIALYQKVKNEAARKRLNIKAALFWCTSKKESLAVSRMALALDKAGFDDEDFAKPIRVNLPVVSDLPAEAVFDTTFCDRYQLGDDGMTFELIPGAVPLDATHEKVVTGTDLTVDDAGAVEGELDSEGLDIQQQDAANDGVAAEADKPKTPELKTVPTLPFHQRVLAHSLSDDYSYHIDMDQLKEIIRLEMDTDEKYSQHLLLACDNVPELETYPDFNFFKAMQAYKTVFPIDKPAPLLGDALAFLKKYVATEHIDRQLMIQAWLKGNREFVVHRTPSGATAGGGNRTDRLTPQTALGLEYEIALGLLARDHEFDIYNVPLQIDVLANSMMNKYENKEFLATRDIFINMPGGFDYSRACNIATVKTTPAGLWETRPRHLEYLNKVMTETDHAHPEQLVVDIACGRSSLTMPMSVQRTDEEAIAAFGSDESTSNEVEKEEEPTAENTDHVQIQEANRDEIEDCDALQPGENSLVDSEETAAVIPGGADILAANAPHLASPDDAEVNQNTLSASQNDDSVSQIEPTVPKNEPEIEKAEPVAPPESSWPTFFEPGRYEGIPNEV